MSSAYFNLAAGNFSQDWANTGLITTADTWTNVPSIIGYRGDDITSATGIDPRTLTGDGTVVVNVIANQTNPNTLATGGVAEFDIANPTIALNGSGTADAPNIVLFMDATGRQNVHVELDVRDLDASVDNATQQFNIQYRIGETGAWTNVTGGYLADATSGPSLGTLVSHVAVDLPPGVNGQGQLQIRMMTTNAVGNDEWIGLDNIVVTSDPIPVAASSVSINDVTHLEGASGTTDYVFTVTRSGGTEAFSVDFATANNTATLVDGDYQANSGTLSFAVGELTKTITVSVNGDTTVEPDESFFVNLTNATNGVAIADGQGQGAITNDDAAPPSVSIDDVTVTEGNAGQTMATFTVSRTGGSGAFTVDYATADDTATTANNDYAAAANTLSFAAGENSKTITVLVNGDTTNEPDETFFVNLTNPTGGATIADGQGKGTIGNDDASHVFQETFTGFTAAGFAPMPGAGQLDSDLWIVTKLSDGVSPAFGFTGAAATDFGRGIISGDPVSAGIYATPAATPTFGAGLLYQPTAAEGEDDGAIVLRLQNTTGAALTTFTASFDWIYRNTGDRASSLVFEYSTNGTTFTAIGDGAFTTPATNTGQAVLGDHNDLTLTGVTLNPDEFLFLRWRHDLSTGSGNRDEFGIDNVTVDAVVPTGPGAVSVGDATITEGDSGVQLLSFTVTRAGTGAFSVDYSTASGTATAGSDFTAASGTLDFAAGETTKTVMVEIKGDITVENNETFFVNLANPTNGALVAHGQGAGTILNDDVSLVAIHDIQGASHTSPLNGAHVFTSGIVTAIDTTGSKGFWIQDPNADADDRTSEAVFVFTGVDAAVHVGDFVRVEGNVTEFAGSDPNNLSTTEIDSPTVTVVSTGNALPTVTIIGTGGRLVPTEVIDNDHFTVFDPGQDAIDFYESLEGMRVTVPNAQAVGPTISGNTTWVVGDLGANATGMNSLGGITISAGDFNPERVQIFFDSGVSPASVHPNAVTGDHLGDVTGIIHYFGGDYELLPTAIGSIGSGAVALPREVTGLHGDADHLTVGAQNVENLDPGDPQAKFDSLAGNIVTNLGAPDIVGLEEVQDADGAGGGSNFSGQPTAQKLIDAIVLAGGPHYVYVEIAPTANNQNGGEPNGNIRQGYLYNPDRVGFVSISQITDTTPANGDTYANSRRPLVGEFTFHGETITLIDVHNTSRLGSEALFGVDQPAINAGDDRRIEQTSFIKTYVENLVAADPHARVMVMGDFNAFQFETSLTQLESGGAVTNLTRLLPANEQFSYNFDGNSQQIDHMLASAELYNGAQFDLVHVNSQQIDAQRTSDHDGSVARFFFNDAPTAVGDTASLDEDASVTINVLGNDTDPNAGDGKFLVSVSETARGSSVSIVNNQVVYSADADILDQLKTGQTATDSFSYTMRDAAGLTSTATVSVTINGVADAPTQTGGAGADTQVGTAGDEKLDGGAGNDLMMGGGGADTLLGGLGNDSLEGGAGIDSLSGSDGNDTMDGGAGDDVLVGARGSDLFVVTGHFGHDTVLDFKPEDDVRFVGAGFANFADMLSHSAQAGAHVVITNALGDTLTLNNVQLATLQSADFLFV